MKVVPLTLIALAMVAGFIALVFWLRSVWEEGGKDWPSLVGVSAGGLIAAGVILVAFNLPS